MLNSAALNTVALNGADTAYHLDLTLGVIDPAYHLDFTLLPITATYYLDVTLGVNRKTRRRQRIALGGV